MPVPATPTTATRARLAHARAADRIRAAIIDGTLQPGEPLRITELAEWLQLSRPPVQEALTLLESEAFVAFGPQRRWRVAEVRQDDVVTLSTVCGLLVADAAHLAIRDRSVRTRERLARAIDPVQSAVARQDPEELFVAATAFFDVIIAACANPELRRVCDLTGRRMQHQLRRTTLDAVIDWRALGRDYAELGTALTEGDVDAARAAIERIHGIRPSTCAGRSRHER
jgi:DNA-binding GntR family transcriptional regulator